MSLLGRAVRPLMAMRQMTASVRVRNGSSSSASAPAASHHDEHSDEHHHEQPDEDPRPFGWTHPRGTSRKLEDWELSWYLGFGGALLLGGLGLYFKPETSIEKWAREEAQERLWRQEHGSSH